MLSVRVAAPVFNTAGTLGIITLLLPKTVGLNRSPPTLPSRSRPSLCWSFMAVVVASVNRPSRLRPSLRSLFWKRSRPGTSPPPSMFSSITDGVPERITASLLVRESPKSSLVMASVEALLPSTSSWLPAMYKPTEPSSALIEVVCTYWLSSLINWSRRSSKSLGSCPVP